MERAQESLDEASLLFESGHTNTAVNRLYYACFYAVSSLLLTQNLSSSKHSGVRAMFHQRLVRTGRVSAELGKFYDILYNNRQKGDYADLVRFERDDIQPWFERTRDFLSEVNKLIEKTMSL
jgi:hypothetical protein